MDAERFDALARRIGTRTSRRVAVGLAVAGLLGVAVPEAAALRCSAKNPCPECYRCRQRRCRKRADEDLCTDGTCQNGSCVPRCDPPCQPTECCAGSTCKPGTADSACGRNGEPCDSCTGTGQTCGGGGTPG